MKENDVEQAIRIAGLVRKYRGNDISGPELDALNDWRNSSEANQRLFEKLLDDDTLGDALLEMEQADTDSQIQYVFSALQLSLPTTGKTSAKVRPVGTVWRWVAAAAVIAAIVGSVWFFTDTESTRPVTSPHLSAAQPIVPGSDKAVLTLSDGTQVLLDSMSGDRIVEQGNVGIVMKGGKLLYDMSRFAAAPDRPVAINTVTTPRGGQYQIVLPDGTAVWLNAASSISFPAAFTGKERRVSLTGEAYFEVASNPSSPFRVALVKAVGKDSALVSVLGTHFNINAYPDEETMRTTVVEGSVEVSNSGARMKITGGEQASIAAGTKDIEKVRPDMEEVLAWKNGKFKFSNTNISSLMKQVARWYDVDIRYEGDLSSIRFSGGISRKDSVEKLLYILESEGRVSFQLEGRNIIVRVNP